MIILPIMPSAMYFLAFVPLLGRSGLRADLQHALGLLHGAGKLLGLLDGVAHGLFEVHVLAVIHGLERDRRVPVIGRGHDHRVDVRPVDDLAIIQISRRTSDSRQSCACAFHRRRRPPRPCRRWCARRCRRTVRQIRAAAAHADDADVDPVVGADHSPAGCFGRAGGESFGSYSQRRADACRLLHEISAVYRRIIFSHTCAFLREFTRLRFPLARGKKLVRGEETLRMILLFPEAQGKATKLLCLVREVTRMKKILGLSIVLVGALLSGGCATKKYVQETAAPIQTKVDQVADQTNKQGTSIEEARKDIERHETGINAAKERAMSAEKAANDAMTAAKTADQKAVEAAQSCQSEHAENQLDSDDSRKSGRLQDGRGNGSSVRLQ